MVLLRTAMGLVYLWIVVLCVASCNAASVSENLVVLVGPSYSVTRGHTTTLPCWINPPQSAEALEVRWYRGSEYYDTPIMHYRKNKFVDATQDASYVGRVSFGLKDATSGGLKTGDVSLKLINVTLYDTGIYSCFVSSDQGYDRATVSLLVTATGSNPLLSVVWKEDNMVNVSCQSEGWSPPPVMRWSDQNGNLATEHVVHRKDSSGLHSVHGWVFVPSDSQVSCSVGLQNEEAKEGRFYLGNPEIQEKSDRGWLAFGLLCGAIAIVSAVLGLMYIKNRGKPKPKHDHPEDQPLMSTVQNSTVLQRYDLSAFNNIYVNITPEDRNNQYVIVKGPIMRDAPGVSFPDGQKVTCLTAIKGTSGFSSGQHYWEVSLRTAPTVPSKQSWWVGVTSASEIPHDADFSPKASNGFWFLSSSKDIENQFQISTDSRLSLPMHVRPDTVGVYLDCDSGELSFYNVEDKSLIVSLTATFTGEVFPFFNPGKYDTSSMKILHRTEQTQGDSDTGNHVDPAEED